MANGSREVFLAAIGGEPTFRPAVASVNQTATYEQMDILGVRWPEANMDAKLMAQLALGAKSILGFDAVKVPFGQTIEQEALGCKINPGDEENLPSIDEHPYDAMQQNNPQYPEDFLDRGRVQVLIKAVELLKEEVGDSVGIIGGVIGPFSIAAELIGITDCVKLSLKNPSALEPFLQIATRCGTELAGALVDAGADVICIEDMMASVDMISPKGYKETVISWEAELIGKIQAPTVLHICGKIDRIIPDMIATGATALSFEPKTDLTAVKRAVETVGKNIGLVGGVDTMDHLFYGDLTAVRKAALDAREEGYSVIAPSCSIPPAATTENLKAMVEVIGQE